MHKVDKIVNGDNQRGFSHKRSTTQKIFYAQQRLVKIQGGSTSAIYGLQKRI